MTVRFGILGPGKVAEVHAAALARIEGAAIAAVAGRNPARAATLAEPVAARTDPDLPTMLARGGIDALIVCTPHPLHAEAAIQAAEAGVHVIVEKPMALTVAEADRMIAAARHARVTLTVISQRRWYPAVRRVKAAIDDARIGAPGLATVELLGWRDAEYYGMDAWRGTLAGEGGGVLINQAVHQLDLLCWFLGEPIEVDGYTTNLNHPEIEVEDTAVAVVRFASGALAALTASNAQRPGLHGRIHVHGRNGSSVGVETDRGSSFVAGLSAPTIARNDLWTIPGEESLPGAWEAADAAALGDVDLGTHFHELQLRDVVDSIQAGRPSAVTGEDGKRTVALIEAIYTAARSAGRVRVGGSTDPSR
ncbi:MAG: Gfo/Idh/MocA family protein [Chloroflexota bacterium]